MGASSSRNLRLVALPLTDPRRHSAHASAAPWEAQNALDAAFVAYSAISVLRQQIKPDHRVHGIVVGREWTPNGASMCIER